MGITGAQVPGSTLLRFSHPFINRCVLLDCFLPWLDVFSALQHHYHELFTIKPSQVIFPQSIKGYVFKTSTVSNSSTGLTPFGKIKVLYREENTKGPGNY